MIICTRVRHGLAAIALLLGLSMTAAPASAKSDGEELLGDQAPTPSAALSHWRIACRDGGGSASACFKVGSGLYYGSSDVRPDKPEALKFLNFACDRDNGEACGGAGGILHEMNRYAEALPIWRKGCRLDDASSCRNLGLMLAKGEGQGGVEDYAGSHEAVVKACRLGKSDVCEMANRAAPDGYADYHAAFQASDAHDLPLMVAKMKSSCFEGNYADACASIIRKATYGEEDWPRDLALAREARKKACGLNPNRDCAQYGDMLYAGQGGPKLVAAALIVYQRGCDYGDGEGCYGVGKVLHSGEAGVSDPVKVAAIFDKACGMNGYAACNALGKMLLKGEGGLAANPEKAFDLFSKDCNYTQRGEACYARGFFLINETRGPSSPRDLKDGREAWESACRHNYATACEALKTLPPTP